MTLTELAKQISITNGKTPPHSHDDTSIPDFLDVRKTRTPEELAADKRAVAKRIARHGPGVDRGSLIKTPKGKVETGLGVSPFEMKKAGAKLKGEGKAKAPKKGKATKGERLPVPAPRGVTSPAPKKTDPTVATAVAAHLETAIAEKQQETAMTTRTTKSKARTAVKATKTAAKAPTVERRPDGLKDGTKKALIADTVCRANGATEAELNKVLGWKACLVTLRRVVEEAGIKLSTEEDRTSGKTRYFGTASKAMRKAG